MKRALVLVGLVVLFSPLAVTAQDSQESPEAQLDFVRKLRNRGYLELALEYLERMQKTVPPDKASSLLLEQARTRVAVARSMDADQRLGMVNRARAELLEFLSKNGNTPDAVPAQLELARLSTFEGQALLTRALREENVKAQQEKAAPAEAKFIQAGQEIEKAAKQLTDEDERRLAQFDLAVNMMDQARTYIDIGRNDLNAKRALLVDSARKVFDKVYDEDRKGAVGLQAAGWLVKCCQEGDDPQKAFVYFKGVMEQTGKAAEPAQRWARYFRLEYIPRNPLVKLKDFEKWKVVQKEAEDWLKTYPAHHKTPAGYGVRYELANALINEALLLKDAKDGKVQANLYKKALDLLGNMNESDNDFAEKANQLNVSISVQRIGDKKALTELVTFDDCYLRAQIEMARVKKLAGQIDSAKSKDEADKLEVERKKHFRDIVRALSRAMALADARVVPSKLDEARYFLVVAHLMSGDMYRVAIAGEAMGKAEPTGKRSALAAGYAIEAYANIFNGDTSDNNRARVRELAEYVLSPDKQKAWANDPVTGVAHYQLALLCNREDDYKGAIGHLQKLPKDFSGYLYAQGQLVFIALEAREKSQKPEDKKAYLDLARKALAAMPKLPVGVDASTAAMYFHAQMEEAKFLYAEGAELLGKDTAKALQKYQHMAGFLDGVSKELGSVKLRDETRDKLTFFLGTMQKYARLGMADVEYKAGNYDKVLSPELTGNVVEQVKKLAAQNPVVRIKDYQITGEVLGLALRASVQKGKIEEAKQILKFLENLKGLEDAADFGGSASVLRSLVVELQVQIRELQLAGKQDKLKSTVGNFSVFLDALVKQSEAKKALDKQDIFFLARCYDSLDQHDKAAGLYARYPAPAYLNEEKKAKEKFTDEQEKELNTYWYVKVMEARQLRLAAKLKEAKKILDVLQDHKNGRQVLIAEKEQNHLLEDNHVYGTAITRWTAFMNNPGLKKSLGTDPKMKEMYFDAYYHMTYCWYKYSQSDKVKAANKETQFIDKAADYVVRLETAASRDGWEIVGPRFKNLLDKEKPLNDAYKRKKGA